MITYHPPRVRVVDPETTLQLVLNTSNKSCIISGISELGGGEQWEPLPRVQAVNEYVVCGRFWNNKTIQYKLVSFLLWPCEGSSKWADWYTHTTLHNSNSLFLGCYQLLGHCPHLLIHLWLFYDGHILIISFLTGMLYILPSVWLNSGLNNIEKVG